MDMKRKNLLIVSIIIFFYFCTSFSASSLNQSLVSYSTVYASTGTNEYKMDQVEHLTGYSTNSFQPTTWLKYPRMMILGDSFVGSIWYLRKKRRKLSCE